MNDDVPTDDGLMPDHADAVLEADRLYELAAEIPPGPYTHRRGGDGALLLFDQDGEPLAHVYAGVDFAKWIEATAPAVLLLGRRP